MWPPMGGQVLKALTEDGKALAILGESQTVDRNPLLAREVRAVRDGVVAAGAVIGTEIVGLDGVVTGQGQGSIVPQLRLGGLGASA